MLPESLSINILMYALGTFGNSADYLVVDSLGVARDLVGGQPFTKDGDSISHRDTLDIGHVNAKLIHAHAAYDTRSLASDDDLTLV